VLPKENRLKKSVDFDKIYKKGQFFGTKLINFKYLENNLPVTRVGFVVGTKVAKSAAKRNLLKRRMREVIRPNLEKLKAGYDIVILAKLGAAEMKFEDVERDLVFALKKAKLM